MNIYFIIGLIVLIIGSLLLFYFISYNKLKEFKDRMDKSESIIEDALNKKLDILIILNNEIKKVTDKKDYLKEYIDIKDMIITNNEKDLKVNEAFELIYKLTNDYEELSNEKNYTKEIDKVREIDETLTGAKNMFNKNALLSNKIIKQFPNNLIAKIAGFKIRSFYSIKKSDDENF